jgi:hypothetical protein
MGVDAAKPESVVNLTGNRGAVLWTANAFLAAALAVFSRSLPVAVSSLWALSPLAVEQLCGSVRRQFMQALVAQCAVGRRARLDRVRAWIVSRRCDVPAAGLQGDARPLQLLGAALAMGYMYQGPPFRCDGGCIRLQHPSRMQFTLQRVC